MNLQEQAKAASHAFLKKEGIQINESLPFIEPIEELKTQSAQAVATRCVVLSYIIGIGFHQKGRDLKTWLDRWELLPYASDLENELLSKDTCTQQEIYEAQWATECVQAMAWCLGMVNLDHFRMCDDDLGPKFPIKTDPRYFISSTTLRPPVDIYFQSDLLYRLHWAARNARLLDLNSPLDESLIGYRRKAMDWVLGVEEDWDEVPLDT